MAGDQGIANAYSNFFHAQEQENLQNDPFYIFTEAATRAAEEWNFEKKKDAERAKKRGDALMDKSTEMFTNALELYNPQAQELSYSHLEVFANRMDAAAAAGDKKQMNQIFSETQAFANQLKQGQSILAEHAKALTEDTYSKGAGTATLNKFLAGGPNDYELFMETDPNKDNYNLLHFKGKDNNGGIQLISFNDLDKGNVLRADAFGDASDAELLKLSKRAFDSGLHSWNDYKGDINKLYKRQLGDTDVLYSAWHDDIFGNGETIAEMWNKEHPNANTDWQFMWNDQLPTSDEAVTGTIMNSGFNEAQMREYALGKMNELAKKDFNKRVTAYKKKASGGNDHLTLTSGSKINYNRNVGGTIQNRTATGQQALIAINWFDKADEGASKTMYNGKTYKKYLGKIMEWNGTAWVATTNTKTGDELGLLGYPQWEALWN